VPVVDDAPDDLVHVVGLAVGLGQDVEQALVHAVVGVGALAHRRRLLAVGREEAQVLPDARDALGVVGHLEVADARRAAVHPRAAQLLLGDVLAHRGAHEVWTGHLAVLPVGSLMELVARDPGAPDDLPAWCRLTGHALIEARPPSYVIRRREEA
jgi:hypothetical protein